MKLHNFSFTFERSKKASINLFIYLSGTKKAEKATFRDVEKNSKGKNDENLNFIERTAKKMLTFMVNRYPCLHKMDNLFIDVKRKSIFYKINQRREPILRKINGTVQNYSLDDESYERLVGILKRQEKHGEDFGEKIDSIENDMKSLVEKMNNMQQVLDEIAEKMSSTNIL